MKDFGWPPVRWAWVEHRPPWLLYLLPTRCWLCRGWHFLGRGRTVRFEPDYGMRPGIDSPLVHFCSASCRLAFLVQHAIEPKHPFRVLNELNAQALGLRRVALEVHHEDDD